MIGPTGVGKTEIARRLARLAQAPFVKVEATKFTEIGYVGRDVESMVRDLTHISVNMVREEQKEKVQLKAEELAEERLVSLLMPKRRGKSPKPTLKEAKADIRQKLREGKFEERSVEIEVQERALPMIEFLSSAGMEDVDINLKDIFPPGFFQAPTKRRKVKVSEARKVLTNEEAQKLIDIDDVINEAVLRVEQSGIIFIDELDKVSGREQPGGGPDISREGVQRDLLPLVEGSVVATRYGLIKTDHVLFVAAGAFHSSKPSDLIPELQGRFPIRVELKPLTKEDFVKILTEPQNALIKQYVALLKTEEMELDFTPDAIEEIASIATSVNQRTEDIGARRLYTIMERLLDDISFNAPQMEERHLKIDASYVRDKLENVIKDEDLSHFIL